MPNYSPVPSALSKASMRRLGRPCSSSSLNVSESLRLERTGAEEWSYPEETSLVTACCEQRSRRCRQSVVRSTREWPHAPQEHSAPSKLSDKSPSTRQGVAAREDGSGESSESCMNSSWNGLTLGGEDIEWKRTELSRQPDVRVQDSCKTQQSPEKVDEPSPSSAGRLGNSSLARGTAG